MKDLERFIKQQEYDYPTALQEIRNGKKESHWIWYIFPQLEGLGRSEFSQYYGIENLDEAKRYLAHPVLGSRLIEITTALLQLPTNSAYEVMGDIDNLKLKSCMTLFKYADPSNPIFQQVLDKYYFGHEDISTVRILEQEQ